ncbi:hypothetical protein [Haladaptatus sp. W1]|nr:hypothetical protein [Haladaptatus sp. W1]
MTGLPLPSVARRNLATGEAIGYLSFQGANDLSANGEAVSGPRNPRRSD